MFGFSFNIFTNTAKSASLEWKLAVKTRSEEWGKYTSIIVSTAPTMRRPSRNQITFRFIRGSFSIETNSADSEAILEQELPQTRSVGCTRRKRRALPLQ